MHKSKLFAWLCAFCPGAGPMYLGQMKKGAVLILSFCAVFTAAILLRIEPLLFLLPVVWMYSFFDTINSVSLPAEEQAAREAKFLSETADVLGGKGWWKQVRLPGSRTWGVLFMVAGAWLLLRGLLGNLLYNLFNRFPLLWDLWYSLPTLALAAVLFFVGLRLATVPKAAENPTLWDAEDE